MTTRTLTMEKGLSSCSALTRATQVMGAVSRLRRPTTVPALSVMGSVEWEAGNSRGMSRPWAMRSASGTSTRSISSSTASCQSVMMRSSTVSDATGR